MLTVSHLVVKGVRGGLDLHVLLFQLVILVGLKPVILLVIVIFLTVHRC